MQSPDQFRKSSRQLGLALSSPITVELEVTSKCNNFCQFCYNVWEKSTSSQGANMKAILEKLIEADVKMLFFTGGEPFLRKDLFDLVEIASNCGMRTSVVTNGTLLTEEKAQHLKTLKTSVQVSLHGTEPTHDTLVGAPGAYARTWEGLQYLKNANVPTNINMALTRQNFQELPHVGEVAASLGAHLSMTRLVLTGPHVNKNLQFTQSTISDVMEFLVHQKKVKTASIQSPFPICCLGKEGIPTMLKIYDTFDVVGCQGGITWCAVSPQGAVRTCGAMNKEEGDLKHKDLKTIWAQSEFIKKCRTCSHIPEHCLNCEYLSVCTGGCRADAYAASQDPTNPDPLAVMAIQKE
ncbi:MAG: radical SAM protein [Candidatus Methanofastidiosia archaeon]